MNYDGLSILLTRFAVYYSTQSLIAYTDKMENSLPKISPLVPVMAIFPVLINHQVNGSDIFDGFRVLRQVYFLILGSISFMTESSFLLELAFTVQIIDPSLFTLPHDAQGTDA